MTALLKHGAMILLVTSLIVAVSTFGYQFFVVGDLPVAGQAGDKLRMLMAAFATALSNAAIPFVGACIIDRMDRNFASKRDAE